jgi:hypothetical protein
MASFFWGVNTNFCRCVEQSKKFRKEDELSEKRSVEEVG